MTIITRKSKLYRLKFSGLPEDTCWISEILRCYKALEKTPIRYSTKYHILHDVKLANDKLYLLFVSYSLGDRPDIINTNDLKIGPSPLKQSQANVTYTHAIARKGPKESLLLIEIIVSGIPAGGFEKVLSEILTRCRQKTDKKPRVKVHIEAISSEEDFFARLNKLDRITSFKMKFPRHDNPGISQAINNLSEPMNEAKIESAEVITKPAKEGSIPADTGIIPHGKRLQEQQEVTYLEAKGYINRDSRTLRSDKFDAERYQIEVKAAEGRVKSEDIFGELAKIVEEVVF